jgi:hypothetical protein
MEPLEQSDRGPFTRWPVEGEGGDPLVVDTGPQTLAPLRAGLVGPAGGESGGAEGLGRVEEEQQAGRRGTLPAVGG